MRRPLAATLAALLAAAPLRAQAPNASRAPAPHAPNAPPAAGPLPAEYQRLAREVLAEAVNTNTTASAGSTTALARKLQARLVAAGYPPGDVRLVGDDPRNQNLVVRLRGRASGRKAILLAAHLDVVEANRADWASDPFTLREENGYFVGRGASDNKSGVTILVTNLLRWKREGWTPDRDVVALFTADEETDATKGAQWVLAHARDLVDAEFCLNTDDGGVELAGGRPRLLAVSASEKVFADYRLEATNPGGHSSRPRPDNAIYALAHALVRLEAYRFPARVNAVTRAQLLRSAALQAPDTATDMRRVAEAYGPGGAPNAEAGAALARLSGDPSYNTLLRTTCVATLLEGGHADNALPQRARATVNCRIHPDDPPAEVERTIRRLAGDSVAVTVTYPPTPGAPSPLRPDVMAALDRLTARYFPGAVVVPVMSAGASDGLYFRNAGIPTYATSAVAAVDGEGNEHGLNERVRARGLYDAVAFWNDLVRALAGAPAGAVP